MVLAPMVRGVVLVVLPCALLGLASAASAESAPAPDVPGQQFPDRGYVDDPDTGPAGGVDVGRPPPLPPPDGSVDTGVPLRPDIEPARDEAGPGSILDSGATLDAGDTKDLGPRDVFLGPPELPLEEPSSCRALGPSGGAAWGVGLVLGALALAARRGRSSRVGG